MNRREVLKLSGAAAIAAAYPGSALLADEIGVDPVAKTVTVGGFTPITGPVPFYAILTHAADAYFKSVNERGGIKGWKIKYVTLDDGYDPARSVAAVRRMVEEDHIFALVAGVGTATNVAAIPFAKESGLAMVGPIGGASAFFSEPNVFPLLPDYGWSAASNAEYAINDLKLQKIALLWENDELGRSAKRGFDLFMEASKIAPAESVSFEVKTTDFTPHLRRVANSGAQAAILFGSNANLAAALKAADRQGMKLTWFAPFFTADPATYKLAGDLLEGAYFSSWLLPVSSPEPEVQAYREAIAKHYPNDPVGVLGLNGWSNAALFGSMFGALVDSGKPINRANLVAAGNALSNASVGGARKVTFTRTDHRGTRQEAILQAKGNSFVAVRDFKPYPAVAFDAKPA